MISFNGGKDITCVLHLWMLFLKEKGLESSKKIMVHFAQDNEFEEVRDF